MNYKRKKFKNETKKLINSFKYAFRGIITSFKSERNMKIHVSILLLVLLMGFIYKINIQEWFICIILFAIVISGELFNTAIETIVDMIMPYQDDMAKKAKDIAAGAVLVLALAAFIIGLCIFIPKIFN